MENLRQIFVYLLSNDVCYKGHKNKLFENEYNPSNINTISRLIVNMLFYTTKDNER